DLDGAIQTRAACVRAGGCRSVTFCLACTGERARDGPRARVQNRQKRRTVDRLDQAGVGGADDRCVRRWLHFSLLSASAISQSIRAIEALSISVGGGDCFQCL